MANYVNVLTDAHGQSGSGISKRHWPHFLHACYLLYQQQYLRDSCDNVQGDTGSERNNNLGGIKFVCRKYCQLRDFKGSGKPQLLTVKQYFADGLHAILNTS